MDDPKLNYNNQNKTSSKQNLVGTGILDTGASLTCLNAQFEKYIFNRGPGGTVEGVNGMTTIQVKGEVHMYFLSTDPGTPGSVHTIPAQIVPGISHNLICVDTWTRDGLYQPTWTDGIFRGLNKQNTNTWIPAYRSPYMGMWECQFVCGSSAEHAAARGRVIEQRLHEAAWIAVQQQSTETEINVQSFMAIVSPEYAYYGLAEDGTDDTAVKGVRKGLRTHARELTAQQLHEKLCHFGYLKGCKVCDAVRATLRKYSVSKRNDYTETRAGYRWYGDTITWDVTSRYGYKYTAILIDAATGYILHFHLKRKDDTIDKLKELITKIRANPYYAESKHGHRFFTELRLDEAGEWSSRNKEMRTAMDQLGVNVEWAVPPDKRDHANAENAMRQVEKSVKAIMMQYNLPLEYWQEAVDHHVFIKILMPRKKDIESSDGDTIRPAERLTMGAVSRTQCNDMISAQEPPGSFCMVTKPHTKGSSLTDMCRAKAGIVVRMHGPVPVFEDPRKPGIQFKSKSYKKIPLPPGVSVWRALNIPEPEMPKRPLIRKHDGVVQPLTGLIKLESMVPLLDIMAKVKTRYNLVPSVLQVPGQKDIVEHIDENGII